MAITMQLNFFDTLWVKDVRGVEDERSEDERSCWGTEHSRTKPSSMRVMTSFKHRSMAKSSYLSPVSSYTSAVIIDGIDKKGCCEIRHHKARRLSLPEYLPASVDDETFAMEQSAPSSTRASYNYVRAPATEIDRDSVERPEDICQLGNVE
ncbi:hypothetical protein T484DRAFT_1922148 [Baffinella frigidus]|nr:hypothetical protein T484DRAFT_1922148 [Cryptophyta sp. CCMP2293]